MFKTIKGQTSISNMRMNTYKQSKMILSTTSIHQMKTKIMTKNSRKLINSTPLKDTKRKVDNNYWKLKILNRSKCRSKLENLERLFKLTLIIRDQFKYLSV